MSNAFVRKMDRFTRLSLDDRRALESAVERTHALAAHKHIITEGDDPTVVNVLLEGWAYRYKDMADGRRQIIALLLPGDMCNPHVSLLPAVAQSLMTLTPVTLARVPRLTILALSKRSAALANAMNWEVLTSAAIQREWMISLGRRTALERLAHLFCEVFARMEATGLVEDHHCEFPLTQADLADAMGLSAVHVNRTIQEMRSQGLVELRNKRAIIPDRDRLAEVAIFDPGYLHLQ